MNLTDSYVVLVINEVFIKNDLVCDKTQGCLIGFVDLGSTDNRLLEFENALFCE